MALQSAPIRNGHRLTRAKWGLVLARVLGVRNIATNIRKGLNTVIRLLSSNRICTPALVVCCLHLMELFTGCSMLHH